MSTAVITTQEQLKQRSLVAEMAEQYGMEPQRFLETMKATVFPTSTPVSNEQLAAFLIVARQYGLNPFIREIYAFPGRNGGIIPVVSIDGWTALINRQKNLDGIEFQDHVKDGKVISITCRIFRKDRQKPTEVTEYLAECFRETEPWRKWPVRMLRHKALIQCARYAFSLSGVYDEDEAERIASQPTGRLELEPDSPLSQAKEKLALTGNMQTSPTTDSMPAEKALQICSESQAGPNTKVFFEVGETVTVISGQTICLKDELPKIGARWDGDARVWRMPVARTEELLSLCEKMQLPAVEIRPEEGTAETLWPRGEQFGGGTI